MARVTPPILALVALLSAASAHDQRSGPCDLDANKGLPFCDPTLSFDVRVEDLISRIPERHVPGLLGDNATEIDSLGIPAYGWWSEGLHGVAISPSVQFRIPTPVATSFPQILNVASSFNRTLFERIGQVIATEARAFHSVGHAGLTYWAPNINIYRDPRWGRGQETPGEDPMLTSEYAVAFVRGMQGNGTFMQVSACCKHFSAYSQEIPRHTLNAIVTKQDLADTYLPAFEACVTRGNVSSIMCSYNAVNGVPSCADGHFLTDLVRDKWKFDGYIVSDCGAVYDILWSHNYTKTTTETCVATLEAGMDLNCGDFLQQYLPSALPKVSKAAWKRALRSLFRTQMRLGMFERRDSQPFSHITPADIDTPSHRQLALDAARQSIVLLKNEAKLLPLDEDAFDSTKRLVLLGPHVDATTAFLGSYAGIPPFIVSPEQGLAHYVSRNFTDIEPACAINGTELAENTVKNLVSRPNTSQVVLFVGLDQSIEAEDLDRRDLLLPGRQLDLISLVLEHAARPVVIVLISGGPVDLQHLKDDPRVGAIVYAGYLGQSGGQAIAEILVGDVNPSGRLAHTFYNADFTSAVAMEDMRMRPHGTETLGRTYRFYQGSFSYGFGHGLSYTQFRYAVDEPQLSSTGDVGFVISVHNVGELIGDQILLCFAEPPPSPERPKRYLVAFERIHALVPGDVYHWPLYLPQKMFQLPDENGTMRDVYGKWILHVETVQVELDISPFGISFPTSLLAVS